MKKIPKEITKKLIKNLYTVEKKSCREIGKILDKSPKQVSRYLKKFNIKARSFSTKGLQTRLGAVLSEETKNKIRSSRIGTGRHLHKGYVMVYAPDHPRSSRNYVPEHRLVVESHIGRYLEPEEIIHHKDENKSNNVLSNLQITTHVEHMKIHANLRKKKINNL